MAPTRRFALLALFTSNLPALQDPTLPPNPQRRPSPNEDENGDTRLPNGKSRNDAIAKQEHDDALKAVDELIQTAEDLRSELKRSGDYVVPVSSVRKTEEIEKLARRIRGKLKS